MKELTVVALKHWLDQAESCLVIDLLLRRFYPIDVVVSEFTAQIVTGSLDLDGFLRLVDIDDALGTYTGMGFVIIYVFSQRILTSV